MIFIPFFFLFFFFPLFWRQCYADEVCAFHIFLETQEWSFTMFLKISYKSAYKSDLIFSLFL